MRKKYCFEYYLFQDCVVGDLAADRCRRVAACCVRVQFFLLLKGDTICVSSGIVSDRLTSTWPRAVTVESIYNAPTYAVSGLRDCSLGRTLASAAGFNDQCLARA